jgi:hypothetical protein
MNCGDVETHCQAFLDRQLETGMARAVESHLAECPCCSRRFSSERAFHGLLKKCVCGCADAPVPARLKDCIRAQLAEARSGAAASASATARPASPVRPGRATLLRGPVAAAAAIMLGFAGFVGFQASCLIRNCPGVMAAEKTHEDILSGALPATLASADSAEVVLEANRLMPPDCRVPEVKRCNLVPVKCGRVDLKTWGEGVYVQYDNCNCSKSPVTLLVIRTDKMPGGEPVSADLNMRVALYAEHRVVSWKNKNNGLLHMLVTELPEAEAVRIAEVASR